MNSPKSQNQALVLYIKVSTDAIFYIYLFIYLSIFLFIYLFIYSFIGFGSRNYAVNYLNKFQAFFIASKERKGV